jgi:hypothetical protein
MSLMGQCREHIHQGGKGQHSSQVAPYHSAQLEDSHHKATVTTVNTFFDMNRATRQAQRVMSIGLHLSAVVGLSMCQTPTWQNAWQNAIFAPHRKVHFMPQKHLLDYHQ